MHKPSVNLSYYHIDPSQLKRALKEKRAYLVDIREQNEVDQGYIEGAFFCPLSRLLPYEKVRSNPQQDLMLPSIEVPLLLYCNSGKRVIQAAQILNISNVYPISWGYIDLVKFGLKSVLLPPIEPDVFKMFNL